MPRMNKQRRLEWSFFLDHRNRISYNPLCRGCIHGCKQSFRAIVVLCPHYWSTHRCSLSALLVDTLETARLINDIRLIQERYAWFLDGIFAGKPFEKKKGQRKTSLAQQIEKKGLEPFVSGVSLGADSKVDAPKVNAQFCIRGTGREAEVVEKMYFDRLLDFVYVEFMKGLQKGFVPKRCANCGRWFLQKPGATYAYCTDPAPGQDGKTCREIGASSSFRSKVENNDVWKVHQRAYKKYYARTMRKDMTKAEFEAWTRDAEQKRDAALEPYARAESEEERQRIAQEVAEALNEA